MFGWLRRKSQPSTAGELIAAQPHGEIFPWPKGAVLTAIDELVLALPTALFGDRPMGESLFTPDDAQINVPPEGDTFFVRLMPGMSISLAKSVQSYVVSEDGKPRRISVRRPPAEA
jgi:hypothetical protein